jgi:hypothetical protein
MYVFVIDKGTRASSSRDTDYRAPKGESSCSLRRRALLLKQKQKGRCRIVFSPTDRFAVNYFQSLPKEVVLAVSAYLPAGAMVAVAHTCQRYRNLILEEERVPRLAGTVEACQDEEKPVKLG